MCSIYHFSIAVVINKFGRGFIKQLGILIAVFSGYIICLILRLVDITTITEASLFAIPNFTVPKFSLGAIVIISPVVLAVFMEHIGDMTTNGAVVGKNFIENPGLNRTLLGDGFATIVAGCLGGPANTTYGENTALLAITKNYDPSILKTYSNICYSAIMCRQVWWISSKYTRFSYGWN